MVQGVTLSTMHGCPPHEIEAICRYMLEEKGLNTFVKLNPTLLGYARVREILDVCGFGYIGLKEESFDHDLKLTQALEMLERLMALAKEKYGDNVLALSMSYGQKHAKELAAAQAIADYYHVELLHMDLSKIFAHSKCSLLQGSEESVPHASYAEQLKESKGEPVSTYVPFRNGLFLSAAASIALEYECNEIYYGPHADDAAGNAYPDCSVEFNESMNLAVYLGSGRKVRLVAPFVDKTKKDIVAEGLRLGVPYELTWSCYDGGEKPCHKCGTCIDREAAFAANGVVDPLAEV